MQEAGRSAAAAHPDIFDCSLSKMEPRPPPRPHAIGRRKIVRKEVGTYIVYNGASRGRSWADSIPTHPKAKDVTLFGLKRTQSFSTEFPFMGHAPTSDRAFSGLLGPLNVDRREEAYSAVKADMERKRRMDPTYSANNFRPAPHVEASSEVSAIDTGLSCSDNAYDDNGAALGGVPEIEEGLASMESALQRRAFQSPGVAGSEPSMDAGGPTFRDVLKNPHLIVHPDMTSTGEFAQNRVS